jgi:hypothetical protein
MFGIVRIYVLAMTFVVVIPCLKAQEAYLVELRPRGVVAEFNPGNPDYDRTASRFHPKALERRERMGLTPPVQHNDRPLSPSVLAAIEELGGRIIAESRWLELVLVSCDSLTADAIGRLAEVTTIAPMRRSVPLPMELPRCEAPRYGDSRWPLDVLQATPLHRAGVFGTSVIIGVIDNGFRWRRHPSLQHLSVLGELDAIQWDSTTANEPGDPPSQDGHGTLVLSILGGYAPDSLIGIAPAATFLLAKTEDDRWERRIEEFSFVAAVEWMERSGAEIISASVGYRTFDSTDVSTPFVALNGRSTLPARIVNEAARRGVLFVTAAGNFGPQPSTFFTPADADSAISIGAVARDGSIARFTSRGPSAGTKQIPTLLAPGADIQSAGLGDRTYIRAGGTSMATPFVSGSFALLRELYPEATSHQLKQAVVSTARIVTDSIANTTYGHVDVLAAAKRLGPTFGPIGTIHDSAETIVYTTLFSEPAVQCFVRIESDQGGVETIPITPDSNGHCLVRLSSGASFSRVRFIAESPSKTAERSVIVPPVTTAPCGSTRPGIPTSVSSYDHLWSVRCWPAFVDAVDVLPVLYGSGSSIDVTVHDAQGGTIWKGTLEGASTPLHVFSSVPSGVYGVTMSSAQHQYRQTVVVAR